MRICCKPKTPFLQRHMKDNMSHFIRLMFTITLSMAKLHDTWKILVIFIQPASHLILWKSQVHERVLQRLAIGSSIVSNQPICFHAHFLRSKT
jgi:hypothetical protein